ncbi:phenylacetate--CoA ligase family protein [Longispora urticae]
MSSGGGVSLWELGSLVAALRVRRRSPEDVERRARAQIRAFLGYCREHVPYYADYPDAELEDLPVLAKPDVVAAGVERFHGPVAEFMVDRTSGTTGLAIEVRHDRRAYGYHGATIVRRFLTAGYRPWWPITQLKPFDRPTRWFQRLGVFPRTVIRSTLPDAEVARAVLASRPRVLMAYPLVLRTLSRTLTPEELDRLRGRLRVVLTDSELLTPEARAQLADAFGVPVFDEYSAYEVLTISSDCALGHAHVDLDRVWVEVLDPDGGPVPAGEEGDVVVTHYRERAMPLVRYRVGDRGALVPGPCGCGSPLPRMRLATGRTDEHVVLLTGRRLGAALFLRAGAYTPGLAECMVRQDATGLITVHLVLERGAEFEPVAREYDAQVAGSLDGTRMRLVEADRVELTAAGKGRFLASDYRPRPDA